MLAILITVALGAVRVAGVTSPAYQALAHCWVGFLFGGWVGGGHRRPLALALGLTGLEVLAFLWTRVLA